MEGKGIDSFMKYDFDTQINRRGTGSLKWDVGEEELPMWVADMDFQAAPEIRQAIERRAAHGIFGYSVIPKAWNGSYVNWWKKRYDFAMEEDWLIFCTGIVPALSSIVRKLTTPGEKVLIQPPVYNMFFQSVVDNGRNILENPLKYDGETYEMDFEDLEEKLADPETTLMILCNPHNPVGRIWSREELAKVGELCRKYHVTVVSDEIHCDLTSPGRSYVPFASVSGECRDNCIICMAPTKTFNLAGLQSAAVAVPNPVLRHKVRRGMNTDEVSGPNCFAVDAAIAAYTKGGAWLDELREYIQGNKEYTKKYLEGIFGIKAVYSEATYLMWLDCRGLRNGGAGFAAYLRDKTGLFVSKGELYGKSGEGFLRVNAACPRSILEDGLGRLAEGAEAYEKEL